MNVGSYSFRRNIWKKYDTFESKSSQWRENWNYVWTLALKYVITKYIELLNEKVGELEKFIDKWGETSSDNINNELIKNKVQIDFLNWILSKNYSNIEQEKDTFINKIKKLLLA